MSDLVIISEEAKALGGGLNGFRESVQRYILRTLAAAGFFEEMAFVGDTALRIGHQLNRFSEDLDFAVSRPMSVDRTIEVGDVAFEALTQLKIGISSRRDFRTIPMGGPTDKLDYICHLDVRLPAAFRSSGAGDFTLRLDIDRNPAEGWRKAPMLIRSKSRPFALAMHDLPSLFAGKLHVLCCRIDRAKGRDFFDLAWYLSREVSPNLAFLDATIQALESKPWSASEWRTRILDRLEGVDFDRLLRDLEPFLIEHADAMLCSREILISALRQKG
jgi:predicted nucleotidyltransferase component of viral defense system